jgi:hypothetical protein
MAMVIPKTAIWCYVLPMNQFELVFLFMSLPAAGGCWKDESLGISVDPD